MLSEKKKGDIMPEVLKSSVRPQIPSRVDSSRPVTSRGRAIKVEKPKCLYKEMQEADIQDLFKNIRQQRKSEVEKIRGFKCVKKYESTELLSKNIAQKEVNDYWLLHVEEHAKNENEAYIFNEFPYEYLTAKSKVLLNSEPLSAYQIEEKKEGFGATKEQPTYVINMPVHTPTLIPELIKKIENESFGFKAKESQKEVEKRVSLVIGLNTFESYNPAVNYAFIEKLKALKETSEESGLSTHLSVAIQPFYWSNWEKKSDLDNILDYTLRADVKTLLGDTYKARFYKLLTKDFKVELEELLGIKFKTKKLSDIFYSQFTIKRSKLLDRSFKVKFAKLLGLKSSNLNFHGILTETAINKNLIFSLQGCYRLAQSYFIHYKKKPKKPKDPIANLLISTHFDMNGKPMNSIIPYQKIRQKILHSDDSKNFIEKAKSKIKYVVSLDGDFESLKSAENEEGFLSVYDRLIETQDKLPHIMSTGYLAPEDEENECLINGLDLDRRIRAALGEVIPQAVYMPEPNFAFLIEKIQQLAELSWLGKDQTMNTESRRFVMNALSKKIYQADRLLFRNEGGIQTSVDDNEWRTGSVNAFANVTKASFLKPKFQQALRGLHQSFADPQIWANNVYVGLQEKISAYQKEGLAPLKAIRELFDPVTMKNIRFPNSLYKEDFVKTLSAYEAYASQMELYCTGEYTQEEILSGFFNQFHVSGKHEKEDWINFLTGQMDVFDENEVILKRNYKPSLIELVVKAASKSGKAIQEFYQENIG